MRTRPLSAWAVLLVALLSSCRRSEIASASVASPLTTSTAARIAANDPADTYPTDISPPPGTNYPCALTPLPRTLSGVPEGDRAYINRTYARVLRATQAKLIVLKALYERDDMAEAQRSYDAKIAALIERVSADPPPTGLDSFRSDLLGALQLQRTFFKKALQARLGGTEMEQVYAISEGREASSRLISAWSQMSSRYPSWNEETKESIYHHLCALDLF
jgi:hypothetical protein